MEFTVSPESPDARVAEIESRLDAFQGSQKIPAESAGLTALWMGLKSDLKPAMAREKGGGFDHDHALVLQFADAFMSDKNDAIVVDEFFAKFGSKVEIDDGRGNKIDVPVTTRNFRAILNSGSTDVSVKDGTIIIPTDIQGVYVKADGSAVTDFDKSSSRSIRPMLLVSTK